MGATNFLTGGSGKSIGEAYASAVDIALYENGHDPYNGTISTTNGVEDHTKELDEIRKKHDSIQKAVYEWSDLAEEHTDKWGKCWGAHLGEGKFVFAGWAAE